MKDPLPYSKNSIAQKMPNNNLSSISVSEYSKNYLVEIIRLKTGWDQRHEVAGKAQLNYLCEYLDSAEISAKTILLENEYIDRHYLEDYTEYYARCFASHPRKCSRVHFFSERFEEQDFLEAITQNKISFLEHIQDTYIGFFVIRPIPHTFLAKVCLKPYKRTSSNDVYRLITKKQEVSLYGYSFTIDTAAFLEQDKVVSACATSALWMLYNTSLQIPLEHLPSPSRITKSASLSSYDSTRTFPTNGLEPLQVARSLKHFGLEPSLILKNSDDFFLTLKEIAYSYISNDIPILIGGDVYKPNDGNCERVGKHLICIFGYHLDKTNTIGNSKSFRLQSHNIDRIYAHDDRYGPYLRIDVRNEQFTYQNEAKQGLVVHTSSSNNTQAEQNPNKEYFVPDVIIFGIYHKIRVQYQEIADFCNSFYLYLFCVNGSLSNIEESESDYAEIIMNGTNSFLTGTWEITLTTNSKIKKQILSEQDFISFNGDMSKESLLLLSMPKYIWRCRILDSTTDNNEILTDLLFDATEVPQGKVLIGYISYSNQAESTWKYIEKEIHDYQWKKYALPVDHEKNLGWLWKFFSKNKEYSYLNTLYGSNRLPKRELKPGEEDKFHNITHRNDIRTLRNNFNFDFLNKKIKYIWVVNALGDLIIGEDVNYNDETFHGHPTLIDNKPARLGGELFWHKKSQCWLLNLKSRAYSSHIKESTEIERYYLDNLTENIFNKINSLDGISKNDPRNFTDNFEINTPTPEISTTPA
ncbi:MAG: hypothetical protein ACXVNF_14020, partial [Neobacillus sp.]